MTVEVIGTGEKMRHWLEEKKIIKDFDSYDAQSLNQVLHSFYASVQSATANHTLSPVTPLSSLGNPITSQSLTS